MRVSRKKIGKITGVLDAGVPKKSNMLACHFSIVFFSKNFLEIN